jgi:hypothetical protein
MIAVKNEKEILWARTTGLLRARKDRRSFSARRSRKKKG